MGFSNGCAGVTFSGNTINNAAYGFGKHSPIARTAWCSVLGLAHYLLIYNSPEPEEWSLEENTKPPVAQDSECNGMLEQLHL